MKRIRKIFIILSLSILLTAIITPEKEEKADAIAITGIIALGALAITAVGGAVAYYNQTTVQEIGSIAYDKATNAGINVADMLAQNQIGMNRNLTEKLAESIEEVNSRVTNNTTENLTATILPGTNHQMELPQSFIDNASTKSRFEVTILYEAAVSNSTNWFRFALGDNDLQYLTTTTKNLGALSKTEIQSKKEYRLVYSTTSETGREIIEKGYLTFGLVSSASGPVTVRVEPLTYNTNYERTQTTHLQGVSNLGSVQEYQQAIDSIYNGSTVSVDYDRIEQIMANSESEAISLTNIESLVTGIQDAIEEGSDAQVGILTTIWNGIKNIPNLIQQTATSTIGAINGIPDALAGLWDDLGAIWTGFGETLTNVNTNIKEFGQSIPNAISNGIDNIRDFNAEMLERLSTGIDNIREIGVNIGTNIIEGTSTLIDRIGTIGSDIIDGIVGIVVPSETDLEKVRENTERMRSTFSEKLNFITVPIKSIRGLFLEPKSLYDVTFKMQGVEVHVLPESFRSSVNILKPVLNGVIVLITFIGIYKKIQGKEVI